MQYKNKIKLFILIGAFFCIAFTVHASEITFKTPSGPLGVGDEFAIPIMLESSGESVNAISGDIVFDEATLSVIRVLSANSIITSWIEAPHASGNAVIFSGIMPGGYTSVTDPQTGTQLPGILATIIFRVEKSGAGTIQFSEAHVYKNDGQGTELSVLLPRAVLSFAAVGTGRTSAVADTIVPASFTPVITRDPALFDGRFAVVFSTTDKETGIDHYEIKEGDAEWIPGESPYLLLDQKVTGTVKVKAVDMADNYRIGTATMPEVHAKSALVIPILFAIALCLLGIRIFVRYYKRSTIV